MDSRASLRALALTLFCVAALSGCDWFLSVEQRIARAEQHLASGDGRAAGIELQNALRSEPGNLRARLMLADLSLRMGDPRAADKELARAIADGASPSQTSALTAEVRLANGEFQQLLQQIDAGTLALEEPARSIYRGLAQLGLSQVDASLTSFDTALAKDPKATRGLIGKAQAHVQQGHSDAAIAELARALEIEPANARAALLMGTILGQRGDYAAAAKALDAARRNAGGSLSQAQYDALLAALAEAQIAARDLPGARATQTELVKQSGDTPLAHFIAARIAMAEQNYAVAVAEAQRVLAAAPDQLQAKLMLGAALLANGNLNQAEAQLSELVRQAPENVEARKLLAQVNLRLQRPDLAMQVLSPVQQAESADPQLGALLGWANLQRGDEGAAIGLLERSITAQPGNPRLKLDLALAYLRAGRNEDAVALLRTLPTQPGDLRRESLLIAAVAASRGAGAARAEVEQIVAAHQDDVGVLNVAAIFYAKQRDFAAARRELERAAALEPRNLATLMNIARIEADAGDPAAARAALQRALQAEPQSKTARLALAQLAARGGDIDGAIKWLEEVRRADVSAVEPRLVLAALYLQQKKSAQSDAVSREALAASDRNATVIDTLGRMSMDFGRYEEALSRFREAAERDPRAVDPLLNAARAQMALGNAAAARESVEKARVLQPDSVPAAAMLISLDLREGRREQALARLEQLESARGQDAAVALLEGDVAFALQSYEAAANAYAAAYKLTPSAVAAVRNYRAGAQAHVETPAALLEAWLARQPADHAARMVYAEALSSGKPKRAIEQYELLAAQGRPSAAVLNNLAWLYFEGGDPRAEETAKRAYDLAPADSAVADTYGWVLVRKGKAAEGLPILERALEGAGKVPEIRYHYAVALAEVGERERARNELQVLTRGAPAFSAAEDARRLLAELDGKDSGVH